MRAHSLSIAYDAKDPQDKYAYCLKTTVEYTPSRQPTCAHQKVILMSNQNKPLFLKMWKPFPKNLNNPTQILEPYQIPELLELALKEVSGEANWYGDGRKVNGPRTPANPEQEGRDGKRSREIEDDESNSVVHSSKKLKSQPAASSSSQEDQQEAPL